MRLHHVQVSCPPGGEAAARRFYVGALGMSEVPKPAALVVDDDAELEPLAERLSAYDVSWAERHTFDGHQRFHVHDPHGNRVEVLAVSP